MATFLKAIGMGTTSPIPYPTVLVVDDDEDLLTIMDLKLKAEGFRSVLSLNAQDIWDIIARTPPDIILLDIHMNGMQGGDICRQIKKDPATSSIPILMFSANDNIANITKECGADGYVTKPFMADQFRKTIQRYL